jgi:hypothetical protein
MEVPSRELKQRLGLSPVPLDEDPVSLSGSWATGRCINGFLNIFLSYFLSAHLASLNVYTSPSCLVVTGHYAHHHAASLHIIRRSLALVLRSPPSPFSSLFVFLIPLPARPFLSFLNIVLYLIHLIWVLPPPTYAQAQPTGCHIIPPRSLKRPLTSVSQISTSPLFASVFVPSSASPLASSLSSCFVMAFVR